MPAAGRADPVGVVKKQSLTRPAFRSDKMQPGKCKTFHHTSTATRICRAAVPPAAVKPLR
ncbi:hypothetical protein [Rhizobium sp. AN73]|uniref:hypothetical protein n=1 Tax=Rhizobium sp. AN73 TaxID=3035124 RepID=UPI002741CA67|nr:hypothetical protein [Rhizobium sp. AN73]